ncbi:MAG: ATP-dependent zinc metalloprotease FtsH [Microgenomates group bacterium GW2011_GWF2_45_18]|nr:MAG: ATP-dependent zinc metalloprotease FtsH [Microgenomates group bacterium GW2011_GWF1_44_10]KKU02150.1 MAG: ATP-dependent zinc metalloprotease FtsH [Microgenomates group bacterium GW2011_GWF2_45_18]HAU98700.1 cell division protein FtsH [Candidatus Paceibacterota bacterium]HAX01874.1 cell division protein FtsH [Candidatus Paceibacterota bacterium]
MEQTMNNTTQPKKDASHKETSTKESSSKEIPQKKNGKTKKFELKIFLTPEKLFVWGLILLLFAPYLMRLFSGRASDSIALSQVISDIRDAKVQKVEVTEQNLKLTYKDASVKYSRKEANENLNEILQASSIDLSAVETQITTPSFLQKILVFFVNYILPMLFLGFLLLFIMRRQMGGDGGLFAMGKSKAKLFNKGKQNVKFPDVGGLKEAKQELEEVVDFLKNPKKYKDVGARVPKGVLLVGPSGTGKTMLAKAVAGEANVPFLSMAGSEFMEMLVGVGASRARDLFETAKKAAPSIIFIDEIDAIGRMRGYGSMGGHDEREQTLNQILVEMDGFTPNDAVIVLAATNRGDLLDPALVRPGRFDRRVTLDLPDLEERKFILNIHNKNKPISKEVDWQRVARRTVGFSGADLENMLNEAAILIARESRKEITSKDIEEAALKVKLGPQKKKLQSELERKMTAYHEGGHAVLAHVLPHTDPVHRISIVSRGQALGFTMTPPEQDKYQRTQSELEEEIVVLLGGRTAEKQVFGELTGGASSDIQHATSIARAMVVYYGMSELGPVNLGPQSDTSDYSRVLYGPEKPSEEMQGKVDKEIAKIIEHAKNSAEKLLLQYRKELDAVAEKLLEVETLEAEEFEKVMGQKKSRVDLDN